MTRLAFIGLFLVALVAIVYVAFSAAGGKPASNPLEAHARGELAKLNFATAGDAEPTAPVFAADGTPVTLDAWKGKTVLVNFWATWCSPCEREMPSLGALQKARGSDAFEVVAISVDASEDKDYAVQRLNELGASDISFHIAPPENYEIVYDAGVKGFPTSILYGPDGKEIARLEGDADWASLEAIGFIDAILAKAALAKAG